MGSHSPTPQIFLLVYFVFISFTQWWSGLVFPLFWVINTGGLREPSRVPGMEPGLAPCKQSKCPMQNYFLVLPFSKSTLYRYMWTIHKLKMISFLDLSLECWSLILRTIHIFNLYLNLKDIMQVFTIVAKYLIFFNLFLFHIKISSFFRAHLVFPGTLIFIIWRVNSFEIGVINIAIYACRQIFLVFGKKSLNCSLEL